MTLIVVIEDNVQNARMAEKLLKKAGHEIIVASDGETGMEKVFENQADLILVDLGLPDIDGQTLVALMRQQPNLTSVPIIAFTAWPEDSAHDMATRYGCDGVIVKPINTRDFAKQIENFMRKTTKK
jgi:CheY-like chemotaxis protein